MRRRWVIHGSFWLVYFLQDTFLHYTWMGTVVSSYPEGEQFMMAVKSAAVLLPPKLLVVYYLISTGVQKLLADEQNRRWAILEIMGVAFVSLIIFRLTFHYLVYPVIYHLPVKVNFFNARNTLIAILEIGYITGIAFTLKLLRLQIASKEREKKLTREKLETELKFLKNQTNPHFLFNTLNNIYALARKKSDKTAEVVMKLSELLSFMLYESPRDTISIDEEIRMHADYIDLEKIRYNERLKICFNIDIDDGSRKIAPLILLPLVENAFKHGVSETRFDSFVNIDFRLRKGMLNYTIENSTENGVVKKNGNSIGLGNTRRQLELLYSDHQLAIDHTESKFKVNISINLDSYANI